MCCRKGKIFFPPISEPPDLLLALLNGDHPASAEFKAHLRGYNNLLCLSALVAQEVRPARGIASFKVKGRMATTIDAGLIPPGDDPPKKGLAMYFYGAGAPDANISELDHRHGRLPTLNRALLAALQEMLHDVNPYIQQFKTLMEVEGMYSSFEIRHPFMSCPFHSFLFFSRCCQPAHCHLRDAPPPRRACKNIQCAH
jgi:hypothetical protein